jgi:hypothetical protein
VQSHNRFFIFVALATFVLSYSGLLAIGPFLLQDADTFWHIRTGQWILDHAQFPSVDFYSYTEYGKPWISTEWLCEIIYAAAFKLGGWSAVAVVAAAVCATVIGILCFYLLRNLRFSVAIGWSILTAAAMSPHFLARPHVFSYVLLAVWMINLLDAYDDEFNLPSSFILAPLMILWANLHGSFTLGLALLYIFGAFCIYQGIVQHNYTKCARLLIITVVVSACALITPYGIAPVFMTTKLLDMKFTHGYLVEWRPPEFQGRYFRLIYLVGIFSGIAGLGIRLRGPRLVTFAVITVMAFSYIRGLMMFFLLVPIILARPTAACAWYLKPQLLGLNALDGNKSSDPVLALLQKRSSAILASCIGLAMLVTAGTWWRSDIVSSKVITPKAAVDFVQQRNISGNVFNWYGFGGYLIFSGIPTFIDGRAELFGDAFVRKYVATETLSDINSAFEMLDEYKVNWVIFPPMEPLAKALARSERWEEVFSDEYSTVFVRRRKDHGTSG